MTFVVDVFLEKCLRSGHAKIISARSKEEDVLCYVQDTWQDAVMTGGVKQ